MAEKKALLLLVLQLLRWQGLWVGAFCWHLRRACSCWRRFEVSWSRIRKAPTSGSTPGHGLNVGTFHHSLSVTAGVVTVVWPLLVMSTPPVEIMIRTCMFASAACICVCVAVSIVVPDVCSIQRSVSRLLALHCHSWRHVSILSYVTLSSVSLASQSSPLRF